MKWKLCVAGIVSVAMKIESMGYGLHGHDLYIRVCTCSESDINVNIDILKERLDSLLSNLDHKPLWEIVGGEGKIEDLLKYLNDNLKIDNLCEIEAKMPDREVYLYIQR
ncbi:MAG: hypothetical protein F7B61_07170 [Caldisphaeraceae archaeon]|nr:hypothetical protein [Caldisphaeraceae archaeon]